MSHPDDLPEGFDPAFYLLANPDVAEAGVDPREHWLAHGRAEGRQALGPHLENEWFYEVRDRLEFLWKAFRLLAFNGITGDYLEFGCGVGTTFTAAWRASQANGFDCHLWGFDSFSGLPVSPYAADQHPAWTPGRFAVSQSEFERRCQLGGVPEKAYTLVPGWFADTLDPARTDLPQDVALAYIDCDLYSSAREVLAFLDPRLKHGCVIAFDDWFCWSDTHVSGECAALRDFERPDLELHPYMTIGWHGMSFLVELHEGTSDGRPRT